MDDLKQGQDNAEFFAQDFHQPSTRGAFDNMTEGTLDAFNCMGVKIHFASVFQLFTAMVHRVPTLRALVKESQEAEENRQDAQCNQRPLRGGQQGLVGIVACNRLPARDTFPLDMVVTWHAYSAQSSSTALGAVENLETPPGVIARDALVFKKLDRPIIVNEQRGNFARVLVKTFEHFRVLVKGEIIARQRRHRWVFLQQLCHRRPPTLVKHHRTVCALHPITGTANTRHVPALVRGRVLVWWTALTRG